MDKKSGGHVESRSVAYSEAEKNTQMQLGTVLNPSLYHVDFEEKALENNQEEESKDE